MKYHKKSNVLLIIFWLLLLNTSVTFSFGQNFDYFENNPEWSGRLTNNFGYQKIDYVNYLLGDSIINSQNYHKVYQRGLKTNYNMDFQVISEIPFDDYYGLIRQEEKKIYFINQYWDFDEEELLYDFDLNLGDTLPHTYNSSSTWPEEDILIIAIDSININGNYHKKFKLSEGLINLSVDTLVEGIGHKNGFIYQILDPFEESSFAKCYRQNEEVYYSFDALSCDFNVSVIENRESVEIEIFPNPAATTLHIKSTIYSDNESFRFVIKDELGRIVKTEQLDSHIKTIDITNLASGLYIGCVYSLNEIIFNDKIVVSK